LLTQANCRSAFASLWILFLSLHQRFLHSLFTSCGRICLGHKKINFSTVFAGQAVGIKEVQDDIWLVSLWIMIWDTSIWRPALEPLENPFGPKVLPM
jgi:hypothetical protein